jgi:hypothetical protein
LAYDNSTGVLTYTGPLLKCVPTSLVAR